MPGIAVKRTGKAGRQEVILAALRRAPAMRVHELADWLTVSPETIRRDLAELDERGLISRTYGGAVRPVTYEPALTERQTLMVEERRAIAAAAADRIEATDILMIGGGATTLHFARELAAREMPLTVITHAFSIAMALSANPRIEVLMLPGKYDGREGLIHGADTIEALARFHANKAVLGASGLSDEGPNDASMAPGLVYGAMMRRAAETLVLADHGKFGRPSLVVYGAWSATTTLVSDRAPDGDLAAALEEASAAVLVGSPAP
jgi:DeoR/GlpR family transcriptional regulator of sugar metabolism